MTVIADGVTEQDPDHVLIGRHVLDHANWQERRLIDHIEKRYRLPVTTFAVDCGGHTPAADGPPLLCYDGSEDARHPIERAGLPAPRSGCAGLERPANLRPLGSLASAGATDGMVDFVEVNRGAAELGGRVAAEQRAFRRAQERVSRAAEQHGSYRTVAPRAGDQETEVVTLLREDVGGMAGDEHALHVYEIPLWLQGGLVGATKAHAESRGWQTRPERRPTPEPPRTPAAERP
jgi:hypothetical protein